MLELILPMLIVGLLILIVLYYVSKAIVEYHLEKSRPMPNLLQVAQKFYAYHHGELRAYYVVENHRDSRTVEAVDFKRKEEATIHYDQIVETL